MLRATVSAAVVLLGAASLLAQTAGPLGRAPRPKPAAPASRSVLTGKMVSVGSDRIELDSDSGIIVFRINERTVFVTYRSALRPGDVLRIEGLPAGRGSYQALRVERIQEAPGSIPSAPSAPPPTAEKPTDYGAIEPLADEDPRRPVLRRGGDAASIEPIEPIEPIEDEDAQRPVLRRSRPGQSSEPEFVDDPEFGAEARAEAAARAAEAAEAANDAAFDDFPPPPPMHSDPIIAKAMAAARDFAKDLPDFICDQRMSRFESDDLGKKWRKEDVVEAELLYLNGEESYRDIRIEGKGAVSEMSQLSGAWSTGEYGTTLRNLFSIGTEAEFEFREESTEQGRAAYIYDYHVRKERSRWRIGADGREITAEYRGAVWIEQETGRALRLESRAVNLPWDFPIRSIEQTVDYGTVKIADEEYLLPVASESLGCRRLSRSCSNNRLEFLNYRKFTASSSIFHTDSEIDFGGEAGQEAGQEAEEPQPSQP